MSEEDQLDHELSQRRPARILPCIANQDHPTPHIPAPMAVIDSPGQNAES